MSAREYQVETLPEVLAEMEHDAKDTSLGGSLRMYAASMAARVRLASEYDGLGSKAALDTLVQVEERLREAIREHEKYIVTLANAASDVLAGMELDQGGPRGYDVRTLRRVLNCRPQKVEL